LSGDYNVMASVITEDIYRRLFDKEASQKRLVFVGRIATLFIGISTIIIGISLIASARKGLFEVMVTVFGLFVGPMLIPMLAGLLSKRVTYRGAAAGIIAGLVSGVGFYLYKTLILSNQPGIDPNWLRYDYEAISILTNFTVTILAMMLTTVLEKPTENDRAQIDAFFLKLSTPVDAQKTHAVTTGEIFSPFKIIGWVTIGTGAMLLVASVAQPRGFGQYVNLGAGLALCLLGVGLYQLHRRFMQREEKAKNERLDNVDENVERAIN
jgi:uncharacterized sodium:solute symporter family permease YidK